MNVTIHVKCEHRTTGPGEPPCPECMDELGDAINANTTRERQRLRTVRELVHSVRVTGFCPGSLTPLIDALSRAHGFGPLFPPQSSAMVASKG